MGPDVASPLEAQGVEVIGVNVRDETALAKRLRRKSHQPSPILLDGKGTVVQSSFDSRPPRTLLLDKGRQRSCGSILNTPELRRRQLQEAIQFLFSLPRLQAG